MAAMPRSHLHMECAWCGPLIIKLGSRGGGTITEPRQKSGNSEGSWAGKGAVGRSNLASSGGCLAVLTCAQHNAWLAAKGAQPQQVLAKWPSNTERTSSVSRHTVRVASGCTAAVWHRACSAPGTSTTAKAGSEGSRACTCVWGSSSGCRWYHEAGGGGSRRRQQGLLQHALPTFGSMPPMQAAVSLRVRRAGCALFREASGETAGQQHSSTQRCEHAKRY